MKFRRVLSYHLAEQNSFNSSETMNQNSNGTLSSSSTSLLSTPSNNIRHIQRQKKEGQMEGKNKARHKYKRQMISNGKNHVKNKLLNLQSLRRVIDEHGKGNDVDEEYLPKGYSTGRSYDYSVFASGTYDDDDVGHEHDGHHRPLLKQSLINSFQMAENVSRNVVFDGNISDEDEIKEEDMDNNVFQNKSKDSANSSLIEAIPGYTKNELPILLNNFNEQQRQSMGFKNFLEDDEIKHLWEFRKNQQAALQKLFSQYLSMSNKRKIQLAQKKDLFHKVFGYGNNVNLEYVTNNSCFSAIDNISSTQKAVLEDKEEVNGLIEEDRAFHLALQETKALMCHLASSRISFDKRKIKHLEYHEFDYEKFRDIVAFKLDKIYDQYDNEPPMDEDEDLDNVSDELLNFSTEYLRASLRDSEDEE